MKQNTRKLIALFLAVFAITSHADTAAQLAATITNYGLTAVASGNTVTVTGTKTDATTGLTLDIDNGVSVVWKAELTGDIPLFEFSNGWGPIPLITLTGTGSFEVQSGKVEQIGDGYAVSNEGAGTVTISGGNISTRNYYAVSNQSTGTVNISGGTVSSNYSSGYIILGSTTVSNQSTGTVNISGGTVSATKVSAVSNQSTGKVTVSGTAKVTSAIVNSNCSSNCGTIYNLTGTVEITGGTVENTADYANAIAIYNSKRGTVNISGGTVSATTGTAVYNASSGTVNISGGIVFAYAGYSDIITNASGIVNITSSDAIILGWYQSGKRQYTAGTNTDIYIRPFTVNIIPTPPPFTATVIWDERGGIAYTSGEITGFFAIKDVKVFTTAGVSQIDNFKCGSNIAATGEPWSNYVSKTGNGRASISNEGESLTVNPAGYAELKDVSLYIPTWNDWAGATIVLDTKNNGVHYNLAECSHGFKYKYKGNKHRFILQSIASDGKQASHYSDYNDVASDWTQVTIDPASLSKDTYAETTMNLDLNMVNSIEWTVRPDPGKTITGYLQIKDFECPVAFYIDESVKTDCETIKSSSSVVTQSSSSSDVTTQSSSSSDVTAQSSSSDTVTPSSSSGGSTPSSSSVGGTDPIRFSKTASGNLHIKTTANAIHLENLPTNAKVEVYNLQGKRIYSAYPENHQILTIGVQTGMYIIKINKQILRVPVI